jgi:hypothetical protein
VAVARGDVLYTSGIYKFGRAPLASSSGVDLWDGNSIYTWLEDGVGQEVVMASTDKSDGSTGDGAKTVQVFGLDSDGTEQNEIVTLDGDTDVALTNTYWRLNRMKVIDCGTDASRTNLGDITATSTDSTVMAIIKAGFGQTLMAIYTIPAGKVGYPLSYEVAMGASNKTSEIRLYMRESTGAWQVKHTDEIVEGDNEYHFFYFDQIPPLCDMRIWAKMADGQTNKVSGQFTLFMDEVDS